MVDELIDDVPQPLLRKLKRDRAVGVFMVQVEWSCKEKKYVQENVLRR